MNKLLTEEQVLASAVVQAVRAYEIRTHESIALLTVTDDRGGVGQFEVKLNGDADHPRRYHVSADGLMARQSIPLLVNRA